MAGKAACLFWAGQQHWSDDTDQSLHHARDLAFRAVASAPRMPWARLVLAQSELFLGHHAAAITAAKHAITLNPSDAASFAFLGHALTAAGQARTAIRILKSAFLLAPYHPNRFMWLSNLALAAYHGHRFDLALNAATEAVVLNPNHWLANHAHLASLSRLGRVEDARSALCHLQQRVDSNSLSNRLPYQNPSDLHHVNEALREIGLDLPP